MGSIPKINYKNIHYNGMTLMMPRMTPKFIFHAQNPFPRKRPIKITYDDIPERK